jgi:hypothetical protein
MTILGSTVRIQYLGAWDCHDLIRYRRYDRANHAPRSKVWNSPPRTKILLNKPL